MIPSPKADISPAQAPPQLQHEPLPSHRASPIPSPALMVLPDPSMAPHPTPAQPTSAKTKAQPPTSGPVVSPNLRPNSIDTNLRLINEVTE